VSVSFVLIGVAAVGWAVWSGLIRPMTVGRYFESPRIEGSAHTPRVGERFTISLRQTAKRDVRIRRVVFRLVMRERAERVQGTDHHVWECEYLVQEHVAEPRRLNKGDEIAVEREMRIPRDGMHSFSAKRNDLHWFVRVMVDLPSSPDVWEEREITVLPTLAEEADDGSTA
jgi:hypothetical protein